MILQTWKLDQTWMFCCSFFDATLAKFCRCTVCYLRFDYIPQNWVPGPLEIRTQHITGLRMLRYVEMCDMQMQDGAKIDWEGASNVFHTIADAAGRPHITYHEFLALCRALANYYKISQRYTTLTQHFWVLSDQVIIAIHGYAWLFIAIHGLFVVALPWHVFFTISWLCRTLMCFTRAKTQHPWNKVVSSVWHWWF